ncbi:hypothetical protein [Sphingobium aquiterrae]|uniref:hypothetical protein n=1 Tax=Sphingobium aquiterrae TaxID=2038656 RepID=UPI003017288E
MRPVTTPLSYADLADFATDAPLVAKAIVTDVIFLKPEQSQGVKPGHRRAYLKAQVTNLIRGEGGITPEISYLYDVPLDSRGKTPKLKRQQILLFARTTGRPGEVQLTAPDAQIGWTPGTEAQVKAIAAEALGASPPPRITDIGDAFHVAGTIAGEGETQIFLKTDNGQPVSLSIVRRPGAEAQWAVALGEIVDEAAATPKPNSLLWYRLACGLPAALPARSVRTLAVADAEQARADYQLVLKGLGPCGRTRTGPA